jgi:hypothetical protein
MTRGNCHFRQADLTRAVKALKAAGMKIDRVEISTDGSVMLHVEQCDKKKKIKNPWDRVLNNDKDQS